MKDPYSVLGISSDVSDEEVKNAYRNLARKYHPDNYGDDNPLKDLANEKMQEVNAAYDEIQKMRQGSSGNYTGNGTYYQSYSGTGSSSGIYYEARKNINSKKFADAEKILEGVPAGERIAEWHYLTSVLLMRRNRVNDAMRELEIACSMEPGNLEYQKAKEMFNTSARGYGSTYYGADDGRAYRRRSTSDDACDCCANLICMDCLCECMGGDLIRCI